MTNKIKEILEINGEKYETNLPKEVAEAFTCIDYELSVCNDQLAIIFDYITNLQEKYEEADNDRHKLFEQKEKAIEYIKDWQSFPHTNGSTHNELKNLLNILGGDE